MILMQFITGIVYVDEVGMELYTERALALKKQVRFWMVLEIEKEMMELVECGEKIGSGNVPPRGIKSHPNLLP